MAKIPPYYSKAEVDNLPVNFGKYNGDTPMDIFERDPGYIVWTREKTERADFCSDELYAEAQAKLRKRQAFNRRPDFMRGE